MRLITIIIIIATVGLLASTEAPEMPAQLPFKGVSSAVAKSYLNRSLPSLAKANTSQGLAQIDAHLEELCNSLPFTSVQDEENKLLIAGVAYSDWGQKLDWDKHINLASRTQPELAILLLQGTARSLGENCLPIVDKWNQRRTSDSLRLQVFKCLWGYAPEHRAFHETRNYFFKEKPKANSPLKLEVIQEILWHSPSPQAEELLLLVAERSNFGDLERRTAIRALVARNSKLAPPTLDSIFRSESRNALVRKESLLALLKLDEKQGKRLLKETDVDPQVNPVINNFLSQLRHDYGLE